MAENKKISFENPGYIYMPNQPCYYSISDSDWSRLKRKVNSCKNEPKSWTNAGFCFLGIMGSAGISYLSLPFDINVTWIKPVLLTVTISTLFLAILCFTAHKHVKKVYTSGISDIQEVIKEIDSKITTNT